MSEQELEDIIRQFLELATGACWDAAIELPHLIDVAEDTLKSLQGARVSTFAEAGVLTMNKGLVLRLRDGREYQVTVVQSRGGGEPGCGSLSRAMLEDA